MGKRIENALDFHQIQIFLKTFMGFDMPGFIWQSTLSFKFYGLGPGLEITHFPTTFKKSEALRLQVFYLDLRFKYKRVLVLLTKIYKDFLDRIRVFRGGPRGVFTASNINNNNQKSPKKSNSLLKFYSFLSQ